MNNFDRYSSREEYIIQKWILNTEWLKQNFKAYYKDNTAFHDYKIKLYNGVTITIEILVEIKEEEFDWYNITGNIGLDFLSAFIYKTDKAKNFIKTNKNWLNKKYIDLFLERGCIVKKYGKLKTCDADIQLFYSENENNEIVLLKAYDNSKLRSDSFLRYLKSNYNLRINDKIKYRIKENWESAAFFVKPSDEKLKECEINSYDNLIEAVKNMEKINKDSNNG